MATRGKKISEQTLAASLDGNEVIPFAKNGASGAVKASKIKEYVQPDLSKLDSLPTATELDAALDAKLDKSVWDAKHEQFTCDGYYTIYGEFEPNAAYGVSEFIPINKNYGITVKGYGTPSVARIVFFNQSKKYIGNVAYSLEDASTETTTTDLPQGAVYFRAVAYRNEERYYSNGPTQESREGAVSEAIQASKSVVFDDLWISAAGSNGTVDHTHTEDGVNKPYYLNEVWMTYEEALVVYNEYYADIRSLNARSVYGVTNFSPPRSSGADIYTNFQAQNAKVINVGKGFLVSSLMGWFRNAPKVTKIIGNINLTYWKASVKSSDYLIAPVLTDVSIYHLCNDFSIEFLKSISLSSMQYMVNNSTATSTITVTVHPDVYAKLTGDTTNAAASALTSDELAQWTALAATANSKNISFATPE